MTSVDVHHNAVSYKSWVDSEQIRDRSIVDVCIVWTVDEYVAIGGVDKIDW